MQGLTLCDFGIDLIGSLPETEEENKHIPYPL